MSGGGTALVVIDVLNTYEHEDAGTLGDSVARTLPALTDLIARARGGGALLVYVNDNAGDWSAGRAELCERALAGRRPDLVEPVLPPADAAFLVKARHSAFYESQLDYMLRAAGVRTVVLAGQVTEQCILYSALDAHVRHYEIVVARDAVAHIHADLADAALRLMELNMHAEVVEGAAALESASRRSGATPPSRPLPTDG